jgi:hypothetical protein
MQGMATRTEAETRMVSESPAQAYGIMVIWHDVVDGITTDYLNWHTSEHMPERIAIPGFLRGRRSQSSESRLHPYLTLYEADDVSTFGSPEYFARLNSPTAWSQRLHPNITNFIRGACEVIASRGVGISRYTLTVRTGFQQVNRADIPSIAEKLCDLAAELPFVTSVKFGVARHDVSRAKTKEAELRGTQGSLFDGVLLIDSYGEVDIRKQKEQVLSAVRGTGLTVGEDAHAVYDLHYMINGHEPRGCREIVRPMADRDDAPARD